MKKIVVAQPVGMSAEQKARLDKLGDVTHYDKRANTPEEWLERVRGFDVVCTGVFGVNTKWNELRDTFVSLPFVGVGWADPKVLKTNNVIISNSPGCNKHAVCEWIIGILLMMTRQLDHYLNIKEMPLTPCHPKHSACPART